jgi:Protein of unknown function (DUF3040)
VPLSEEELRLLEQMERALVQEDPKLASTLRGTSFRHSARRRAILAGVGFAVGVAVLIAGAYLTFTPLGIAGFVIMLGSATMALAALRGSPAPTEPRPGAEPTNPGNFTLIEGGRSKRRTPRLRGHSAPSSGSFMERMEERWRRRRDERGGY